MTRCCINDFGADPQSLPQDIYERMYGDERPAMRPCERYYELFQKVCLRKSGAGAVLATAGAVPEPSGLGMIDPAAMAGVVGYLLSTLGMHVPPSPSTTRLRDGSTLTIGGGDGAEGAGARAANPGAGGDDPRANPGAGALVPRPPAGAGGIGLAALFGTTTRPAADASGVTIVEELEAEATGKPVKKRPASSIYGDDADGKEDEENDDEDEEQDRMIAKKPAAAGAKKRGKITKTAAAEKALTAYKRAYNIKWAEVNKEKGRSYASKLAATQRAGQQARRDVMKSYGF